MHSNLKGKGVLHNEHNDSIVIIMNTYKIMPFPVNGKSLTEIFSAPTKRASRCLTICSQRSLTLTLKSSQSLQGPHGSFWANILGQGVLKQFLLYKSLQYVWSMAKGLPQNFHWTSLHPNNTTTREILHKCEEWNEEKDVTNKKDASAWRSLVAIIPPTSKLGMKIIINPLQVMDVIFVEILQVSQLESPIILKFPVLCETYYKNEVVVAWNLYAGLMIIMNLETVIANQMLMTANTKIAMLTIVTMIHIIIPKSGLTTDYTTKTAILYGGNVWEHQHLQYLNKNRASLSSMDLPLHHSMNWTNVHIQSI